VGLESHRSHQGETQRDGTLGHGASDRKETRPGSLDFTSHSASPPSGLVSFGDFVVLAAVISTPIVSQIFLSYPNATFRSGYDQRAPPQGVAPVAHIVAIFFTLPNLPACQCLSCVDPCRSQQLPITCGLKGERAMGMELTAGSNLDPL
jgi:hypothetical protein